MGNCQKNLRLCVFQEPKIPVSNQEIGFGLNPILVAHTTKGA